MLMWLQQCRSEEYTHTIQAAFGEVKVGSVISWVWMAQQYEMEWMAWLESSEVDHIELICHVRIVHIAFMYRLYR